MKVKFCKRVLSVLLCISVFFSFSTVAFAEAAVVGTAINILVGILEGLISDGIVSALSETDDGYVLDKDNYEKFAAALGSTPFPKCGEMVSTYYTTDHALKLYCPDYGYSDWYCQPYIVSDGNLFIISAYVHCFYSDDELNFDVYKYTDSYSSADLFSSSTVGDYKFVFVEGSFDTFYGFQFRLRSSSNIASFNSYTSSSIPYANCTFKQSECFGSSVFDKNNVTDYGYYMSRTPFSTNAFPSDSIPDGGTVIVPRNASSFGDLRVGTVGGSSNGENSGNIGNGGIKGDITVSGNVDVNIIVPDINININGNGGDPNDYIDPGEIDTNLDNYLQYVPEVSKGFIDYLKDFFSWLPPPVFGILMLGLVVAVFCRLTGR